MPITTSPAALSFAIYYSLPGNNNDKTHALYRKDNPWQIAKRFIEALATSQPTVVSAVTTLDDSVFQVFLKSGATNGTTIDAVVVTILNAVAGQFTQMNGDRVVAVVPDGGLLKEMVHTP